MAQLLSRGQYAVPLDRIDSSWVELPGCRGDGTTRTGVAGGVE